MKNNEISKSSNSVTELKKENLAGKDQSISNLNLQGKEATAKKHIAANFNYWAGSHFLFYNVA